MISSSTEETRAIGRSVGRSLLPGDIVCLSGDLGAGKTVMVQGITEGIESPAAVSSPTFTLMHQYPGRLLLLHLDLYRLETMSDLEELGWEEFIGQRDFLGQEAAVVIEWAERIKSYLPRDYLDVCLERDSLDHDKRVITLTGVGSAGSALLGRIREQHEGISK